MSAEPALMPLTAVAKAIAVPTDARAVNIPIPACSQRFCEADNADQTCTIWVNPHATMKVTNSTQSQG